MLFSLLKPTIVAVVISAFSVTASPVVRSEDVDAVSRRINFSAEFCLDPNAGGDCLYIYPQSNGQCLPLSGFVTPTNGVSSFYPLEGGVECTMFTGSSCDGDAWFSGISLTDFSVLSLNGISPDNAINSFICTGGF